MTVYVDLLFGLNTLINYLLLRGSAALGGCPVKLGRLAAAAILGGLYAVAAVLPGLEGLQGTVFQGVCAGLMLLTAFGWKRNTVKQGLFFFALMDSSILYTIDSGAVLVVVQLAEPDCVFLGGRAYYAVSTPALLLLAGLSYAVAAVILAGCGTHTGGDIVQVSLTLDGRQTTLRALRDTGNTLHDPVTGQPVLVVGRQVLTELLPGFPMEGQLQDPAALMTELAWQYPKLRFRLVPYRAVGVESGMLLAVRCQLRAGKDCCSVLAAFSPTEVSADGRFEALWGGDIR